jgi:hypothetical protein
MPLSKDEMTELIAGIQALAERLSSEQVLDLADVLHDVIRDRQIRSQRRSWAPQEVLGAGAG